MDGKKSAKFPAAAFPRCWGRTSRWATSRKRWLKPAPKCKSKPEGKKTRAVVKKMPFVNLTYYKLLTKSRHRRCILGCSTLPVNSVSFTIARRFLFLSTQRAVSHRSRRFGCKAYLVSWILSSFFSLLFFFSSMMFPKKEPRRRRRQKMAPKIQNFYFPKREKVRKIVCLLFSFERALGRRRPRSSARWRRRVWHRASGDVFFFVWDDGPTFGILDDGTHAARGRASSSSSSINAKNDFEARRTRANVRVREKRRRGGRNANRAWA